MAMWLLKTEPDCYPWQRLVEEGKAVWDGVTNAQALIHLRAMQRGDEAFIYHTGGERAIVGLARIVSGPYEDPRQPGLNARGEPKFAVVDVNATRPAKRPVMLAEIRGDDRFASFALVKQPRLSVMPVPRPLERLLREMSGL
jgi:predicted RNA-binding protein with PUA-like domain